MLKIKNTVVSRQKVRTHTGAAPGFLDADAEKAFCVNDIGLSLCVQLLLSF